MRQWQCLQQSPPLSLSLQGANLQRSALYWGGGGGQGCGRSHSSDHAGVMLQGGQQQRLSLDELGLQQHLGNVQRHRYEHTHFYNTIKEEHVGFISSVQAHSRQVWTHTYRNLLHVWRDGLHGRACWRGDERGGGRQAWERSLDGHWLNTRRWGRQSGGRLAHAPGGASWKIVAQHSFFLASKTPVEVELEIPQHMALNFCW